MKRVHCATKGARGLVGKDFSSDGYYCKCDLYTDQHTHNRHHDHCDQYKHEDEDETHRGDIANNLSGDSGHQPGSSAARPRTNLWIRIRIINHAGEESGGDQY